MLVSRFEFNYIDRGFVVRIFRNIGGMQPYNLDLDSVATDREAAAGDNPNNRQQNVNDAVFYEQAGYR